MTEAGCKLREGTAADEELFDLRRMYEPYVYSLSAYLRISVPPWIPERDRTDNWQASAWGRSSTFQIDDASDRYQNEHF
jgi:hypothetical protein